MEGGVCGLPGAQTPCKGRAKAFPHVSRDFAGRSPWLLSTKSSSVFLLYPSGGPGGETELVFGAVASSVRTEPL